MHVRDQLMRKNKNVTPRPFLSRLFNLISFRLSFVAFLFSTVIIDIAYFFHARTTLKGLWEKRN